MRIRTFAVPLALAVSLGAAHAQARGATPNGVIYSDCRTHPIAYSAPIPANASYFNLDLTVLGPDGLYVSGDYLASSLGDPPTGTADVQICGYSAKPGTYTVTGEGSYDIGLTTYKYALPSATFTMRRARTKTVAISKPSAVTVRVKDERPNGYFLTDFATVYLEQRVGKVWKRIPRTKRALSGGRDVFRLNIKTKVKVRAVTLADDNYAGSKSKPVVVRPG